MRKHTSRFPNYLIVAETHTFDERTEWRTFTHPHHAANWLANCYLSAPASREWCRVAVFTAGTYGANLTGAINDAAGSVGPQATKRSYLAAVTEALKVVLRASTPVTI